MLYKQDQLISPENALQLDRLRTRNAETGQAYNEIMTNRGELYGTEPRPVEEWQAHLAEQATAQPEIVPNEAFLGRTGCAIVAVEP